MRVEDKEVVFDIYKAPKLTSHYEYVCMISVIEGDKYGVLSPPKSSVHYLIK